MAKFDNNKILKKYNRNMPNRSGIKLYDGREVIGKEVDSDNRLLFVVKGEEKIDVVYAQNVKAHVPIIAEATEVVIKHES